MIAIVVIIEIDLTNIDLIAINTTATIAQILGIYALFARN
jgi:hypothetical protein